MFSIIKVMYYGQLHVIL